MGWPEKYPHVIVSAPEAVSAIRSGNRVFLTGNCSVPRELLSSLVSAAPSLQDVELCHSLAITGSEYVTPELAGHLRANSLFISSNVRAAVQEGRADFTPVFLSELPLLFSEGCLPLDVALVHLSPPDEHGFCTFGIESGLTKTAAESSKIIVAEVNQQMPRILGDTSIHISRINHIIPVDYPLAELAMAGEKPDGVVMQISALIAQHIPDGATLQTGIGAIPDTVLGYLSDRKDLGIHSELFSDGVIDLVEKGVITGARKTLHPGKIVSGFLLGTKRLYRWADNNPMIEVHCTEYVNHPCTIMQNERMVAMNSAIEVDLTGQVCADSIGTRFYSGVGGQVDFIYGTSQSKGGLPIIAMPSTTTLKDGTLVSRIAVMLKPGAGVTTTRNHVHWVTTEYGMVNLHGKTIRQRAQLLISIAHPQFRDVLTRQAKELNYL
jgi:4-hydroxybutyrate CoA-transferase